MPDNLKAVAVGEASASKQNLVKIIAAAKTTALTEASEPAAPAIPMQRSLDPATYSNVLEYEKYVGPANSDIVRGYMERELRSIQTNAAVDQRRIDSHEEGAWAQNDELGTLIGQGKQGAASLAGGGNNIRMFGAIIPDTLKAHFSQGSEVDERGRELFKKNQDRLNTENELHNRFLSANAALQRREIGPTQMQEEYAAIKAEREALPKLTDEENAYLDSKFTYGINEKQGLTDTMTSTKTRRESLQTGIDAINSVSRTVKKYENNGIGDLLNTTNRVAFDNDLDKTIIKHEARFSNAGKAYDEGNMGSAVWNAAAGIAGIVKDGVGDIINNPAATIEYIAENAPILAIGYVSPMLLGAVNTAYSLDIYRQALTDYKDQNGILPTQEDAQVMLSYSLAAGALEHVTDMSILKVMRGGDGVGSKLVGKVLDGLDNKIVNNVITRVAGNTVTGYLKEGGTELAQTAIEENFSKLNTDFNLRNLAKAGIIGGAVGAAFSGTGSGLQELKKAAIAISKYDVELGGSVKKPVEFGKQSERDAAMAEAINSGSPGKLIDPKSRIYNLRDAMVAMSHYAYLQKDSGNLNGAVGALEQFNNIVDTASNAADEKSRIYEASLNNDDVPTIERNRLKKEADDLHAEVNLLEITRDEFFKQATKLPTNAAVDDMIQAAAESPEVAEQIINLTMRFPGSVSKVQVTKLRESGVLNEDQLSYIEGLEESRALYDSAIEQVTATGKTPKEVLNDVIEGGRGFRGMGQYRIRVSSLITSGNRQAATTEINGITKFLVNHENKAVAYEEAIKQFNAADGNKPIYIIKAPDSPTGWEVTSVLPAGKKAKHIKKENGFVVEPGRRRAAENTLATIKIENKIIKATHKELSSAVRLAFNAKPPKNNENTPPPNTEEFNTEDTSGSVSDLLNTNATSQSATANAAPTDTKTASEPVAPKATTATEAAPSEIVNKARTDFETMKGGRDHATSEAAIRENVGEEAAQEYAAEVTRLTDAAVAERVAQNKKDAKPATADATPPGSAPVVAQGTIEEAAAEAAAEAKDAAAADAELKARVDRVLARIASGDEHHSSGDEAFGMLADMYVAGEFLVYEDNKVTQKIPFDSRIMETAVGIYEKNFAYWGKRAELGLAEHDSGPKELRAAKSHTDNVGRLYSAVAEAYLAGINNNAQLDVDAISDGDAFELGEFSWEQTLRATEGDEVTNPYPGICLTTAPYVAYALRKAGLPSTTAGMGQKDFSGFTDKSGDHYVALTEINGVSYIVDQPQGEIFEPLTPPKANTGTLTDSKFRPRFIENTPENVAKFYGGNKIVAPTGNQPLVPGISSTIDAALETYGYEAKTGATNGQAEQVSEEAQLTEVQKELADVAGLARLLGIESEGNGVAPKIEGILDALSNIIDIAQRGNFDVNEVEKEIPWLNTVATELTQDRRERATWKTVDPKTGEKLSAEQIAANKAKFEKRSKGNEQQYFAIQLAEELIELTDAMLDEQGSTDEEQMLSLETLKRELKVLRFGADTVIKDENSPYNGMTNDEAYTAAREKYLGFIESNTETDTETAAQPGDDVEVTEEQTADLIDNATSEMKEDVGDSVAPTRKEGGLAALDPEKRATDYLPVDDLFNPDVNLIAALFKQGNSTAPLASIPDFMTMLSVSDRSLGEELAKHFGNEALSGDQVAHFKTLIEMWQAWTTPTNPKADPRLVTAVVTDAQGNSKKVIRKVEGIQKRLENVYNDWLTLVEARKARPMKIGEPARLSFKMMDLSPDLHQIMEQNLATAMVVAGFQFVAENSGGNGYQTDETLKRMLGISKEEELAEEDRKLNDAGFLGNFLALELGAAVTKMLDIKALDTAYGDMLARLQLAIGTHIIQTLEQEGIVEATMHVLPNKRSESASAVRALIALNEIDTSEMSDEELAKLSASVEKEEDASKAKPSKFYRIRRNAKRELNPIANRIYESRQNAISKELWSGDVITKIFDAEPTIVDPASEPGQFEQKLTKTGTKVPSFGAAALSAMSEREHGIREDMWATDNEFTDLNQKRVRGWVQTEGVIMHAEEARAQEARNLEYERDLENLTDYRERIQNGTFYLVNEMWKHQRIGQASNTINTLTSKSQRHHVFMKEWETEIDPNDGQSPRNKLFKLSVAQGLGIGTDKMTVEAALAELASFTKTDEDEDNPSDFHAALAAVSRIPELKGEEKLTLTEQEDIIHFTSTHGHTHALDALVHWAAHERARINETTFTSRIMYEIDGVTNGPAFALLMLGMMGDGGRFGMFSSENTLGNWLSDANNKEKDLYRSLARTVLSYILNPEKVITDPVEAQRIKNAYTTLNGLLKLTDKEGRDALKTPTQSIVFGAGAAKAMQNMGVNTIVANFYKQMTEIARDYSQGEKKQVEQMNAVIEQVNSLLWGFKNGATPEKNMYISKVSSVEEGLKNTTLSDTQLERVRRNFDVRFGKVTKAAVHEVLGKFIDTRSELNQAATGAAALYRAARKYFYDQRVAELVAEGKMYLDKNGNPVIELSKKDLRELDLKVAKMLPIVPTAMSQLSGGAFYEGIRLDKQSLSLVDSGTSKYTQRVKLGAGYKGANKTHEVRSSAREFVDPGVASFVLMLHSFDSAVLHKVLAELAGLGIHDAIGLGVDQIIAGGTAMNKAVFDLMLQYSIPMELSNLLGRVLNEGEKLAKDNPGLAEVLASVALEIPYEEDKAPVDKRMHLKIARKALLARRNNLVEMNLLHTITQYAMEGAEYVLSEADHVAIAEKIEAVDRLLAVNSKARAAISVADAAKWEEAGKARAAESKEDAERAAESKEDAETPTTPGAAETRAQDTPWGVMGKSSIDSVPEIEALFKNGKGPKLGDFVKAVSALTDNAYYKQLLGIAGLVVDADTELYLIEPDTAIGAYPGLQAAHAEGFFEESAAVFSINGGKSRIFFKSSAFFHSGLNVETVTHELVHGGTAQAIATFNDMDPKKVAQKDKVVYQAVQELKALYGQMEKAAKGQFELAFVNLSEFVAHGMTDEKFQDWLAEQTAQVSANADAGQTKSALRKFIEVLSDIFFHGRNKEAAKTAMGVLITNTGLLFADKRGNRVKDVAPLTMKHGDPRSFNSEQVFEALEDVQAIKTIDPDFRAHLLSMLNQVTEVVYQGGVLKAFAERQAPATPLDTFIKAITTGEAPFASKLQALRMSNQELFTAESIEVVMRHILNDKNNPYERLLRHEITALMAQARKVIEPMNLNEFDLLFRPAKEADGNINHLSQFMAAALTYKPLYDILNTIIVEKDVRSYKGLSVGNKIKLLFERAMRLIRNILLRDPTNQTVNKALKGLAVRAATIEAKRKATIQRRQGGLNAWIENKEEAAENVIDKGKKKLVKAIKSPKLRNHKSVFVQAASVIAGSVVEDTVENYMQGLFAVRSRAHKNKRLGVIAEIANEMRINSPTKEKMEKLLVEMSKLEQDRLLETNTIGEFIRDSFGIELSEHQLNALTRIYIRGDLQSLLEKYGLDGIDQMLSDKAFLDSEIAAMEQALPGSKDDVTGYIIRAKNLAWYMSENKVVLEGMAMNAHNIAFIAGAEGVYNISNEQGNSAQAILDPLISMYFIKYSGDIKTSGGKAGTYKVAALDILRRESARTDGNGVEVLLKLSRELVKEAKQEIFDGSDILMQKGYVKETFDHTVDVKIANDVDGANLLLADYTKVGNYALPQDPADPTGEPRYLFVIKDKGLPDAVGGALSTTSRKEKGYTIQGAMVDADGEVNLYAVQMNAELRASLRNEIARQRKMPRSWDPRIQTGPGYMVPVYNKQGQAVKFRYLMSDATKDSVLNRINTVDKVMGNIAGSILDKARSPQLNINAIDALRADYVANFGKEQDAFIRVAPDSADPQIAERFRLLPRETQDYIRDVWGERGMWVRSEAYMIAFGYKKYSIGEMFNKDWADRKTFEKIMTGILTHIPVRRNGNWTYLGQSAATRIVQAENMWIALVKWVKDSWVIKNIFTLLFNESSNLTILMLSGVPLVDIIKNKVIGISATLQYRAEAKEKAGLEKMVRFGIPQGVELARAKDRILELEASLKTNPIAELVDAGMFQTLVEDIGQENDPYSYQSRLERSANKITKQVLSPLSGSATAVKTGNFLKTAGKNLLMTHDTGIYKFANQATIFSDFTSRYVMYKHFTTRKRKPMAKDEALSRARKAFVNYDVPTHPAIQYLNDTGFIWFTKYYLRIQAVIAQLIAENPVRATYLIAADNFLFPIADILDSSMFNKWPVSLGAGALEVVGAPAEIATMNAALWSIGR